MTKRDFVLNVMENDTENIGTMDAETAANILDWMRGDDESAQIPVDLTADEFAAIWNEIKGA